MGWKGGRRYQQRNAKVDANQPEIVEKLNSMPGVSVAVLHRPVDICVGVSGIYYGDGRDRNFLFEIKDPAQFPSDRKLTKDQEQFFIEWAGQVNLAETLDDILEVIGLPLKPSEV